MTAEILPTLEGYYDAVPRRAARAEDFGPLTLFVRDGPGFPYYARPTLGGSAPVTAADVTAVRGRQVQLGIPEAFEWVAETTPSLHDAARAAGLAVHSHPLMVLSGWAGAGDGRARVLGPLDPAVAAAVAVANLAFGNAGTAVGTVGFAELRVEAAAVAADGADDRTARRIAEGVSVLAAAFVGGEPVSSGQHNPVGAITEIVGVGTLPAHRRAGHGRAVTAALVQDALDHGVTTVFLSAGDDDVARVYGGLGFVRVGTAMIAEAPQ